MKKDEEDNARPIMHIHKITFEGQDIVLDFHEYKECTFNNCNMVFYGYGRVGLVGCEFTGCRWSFSGPASMTLNFMANLYKNGNGAEKIIEETFRNILEGRYL